MRSKDELKADARASSRFADDGSLILFGKSVREIVPAKDGGLLLRWDDGSELDFSDWFTALAVIFDSACGEDAN